MNRTDGTQHEALLLLDFQYDFLHPNGRLPIASHQVEGILACTQEAIATAQQKGDPIITISNAYRRHQWVGNIFRRGAAIEGSPGAARHEYVVAPETLSLQKWRRSAFSNPGLENMLRERQVTHIVLAGLFAKACISATTRAALKRGFAVSLLEPAIGCTSDQSKGASLRRLEQLGATVVQHL